MNHWAQMLSDLPLLAQRQIARTQRIAIPRREVASLLHVRLRAALCHARTVQVAYAQLPIASQQLAQDLRGRRGGVPPAALAAWGGIRSWRAIAADPHPRSPMVTAS